VRKFLTVCVCAKPPHVRTFGKLVKGRIKRLLTSLPQLCHSVKSIYESFRFVIHYQWMNRIQITRFFSFPLCLPHQPHLRSHQHHVLFSPFSIVYTEGHQIHLQSIQFFDFDYQWVNWKSFLIGLILNQILSILNLNHQKVNLHVLFLDFTSCFHSFWSCSWTIWYHSMSWRLLTKMGKKIQLKVELLVSKTLLVINLNKIHHFIWAIRIPWGYELFNSE
jgi:hypothetical protein